MKKRMQKMLSLFTALTLIVSMLSVSVYATETNPFTDVDSDDWYYDAVQYVYEKGLMNGTSASTFSPDVKVNRAMMVTILYRLEGEPEAPAKGTFTDVLAGQYYTEAVEWAASNKITTGYGDGLFGPDDQLTREQMATFYYNYAGFKGYDTSKKADLSGYTDVNSISPYALDAIKWTNAEGLIKGVTSTTLSPLGDATRAQLAEILCRFVKIDTNDNNNDDKVETEKYTVTFDYNYGKKGTYKTVSVDKGAKVVNPGYPSRGGYSFKGWYTETTGGDKFDFETAINADITLYARWEGSVSGGGGSASHTHSPDATTGYCAGCGKYLVSSDDMLKGALNADSANKEIIISDGIYSRKTLSGDTTRVSGTGTSADPYLTTTTITSLSLTGGTLDGLTITDGLHVDYSTSPAHYDIWSMDIGTLTLEDMTITDRFYVTDTNDGTVTIDSLVFKNVTFDMEGKTADAAAHIISTSANIGSVTFDDCDFINCENVLKPVAIDCRTTDDIAITVKDCTFENSAYNAIQIGGSGGVFAGEITITGNTIGETVDRGIRISTVSGSVTISNNTMTDSVDDAGEAVKFVLSGSATYTAEDNTLNNEALIFTNTSGTVIAKVE